jgi:hypothetical protein
MFTRYMPSVATAILATTTLLAHAQTVANPCGTTVCYTVPDQFTKGTNPNTGMPFITITTNGPFATPDGKGEKVGKVFNLTLKLAREYDANNSQYTRIYLYYHFSNRPGGTESNRTDADQRLYFALLDKNGNPVISGIPSQYDPAADHFYYSSVPRDSCQVDYYVQPPYSLQFGWDKTSFDFVGKDIQSIEIGISGFGGYQGDC